MPARAIPLIYRIAAILYGSWTGFGFFWLLSPAVSYEGYWEIYNVKYDAFAVYKGLLRKRKEKNEDYWE
jgi:hypothetical protein